jgi:LytS/YehU family sensor histidine kinase
MRYVLYEGNKPTIPLTKEVEFLRHYVSLMKIRYSESIAVELSLPDGDTGAEVPPLMFATFVENAFKHGVSYAKESFINVRMSVENGKIIFKCINSRNNDNPDGIKGIGLANVRQRLELIYGEKYTLHVDETPDIYEVLVIIPSNDYDTLSGNR